MGRRCWQPLWFPLEEGNEEHRNLLGGGGGLIPRKRGQSSRCCTKGSGNSLRRMSHNQVRREHS